jgi:GNAT superfamily N-acetyltransferase
MAIELVDFDDAYRDFRDSLVSLHYSAWGGIDDLDSALRARRSGFPFAPYLGIYAREGNALLSGVFVSRYPLTTPDGPETVAGIELLMTRPDAVRRGLAGTLLQEVHRRERSAGHRLSLLCTGRSNLAHELYLKLGYRDIFSPRSALRFVHRPTSDVPPGIRVRRAGDHEAPALARVHHRANAGALGFTRRSPRSFRIRFLSGAIALRNLFVAERQGRVEGYATLEPHTTWNRAAEVVAPTLDVRRALMASLERRSKGRWLALASDWFSGVDDPELCRCTPLLPSYAVMMACPLVSELRRREPFRWLRSNGRPFACQLLDMF